MPRSRARLTLGRRTPAQALVEFALLVPAVVVILVGATDLGRAFYTSMVLHQAVQDGALVAQNVNNANAGKAAATAAVRAAIRNTPPSWISITDGDITLSPNSEWDDTTGWNGCAVFSIRVDHSFRFITPILSATRTLPMSATISGRRNGSVGAACT